MNTIHVQNGHVDLTTNRWEISSPSCEFAYLRPDEVKLLMNKIDNSHTVFVINPLSTVRQLNWDLRRREGIQKWIICIWEWYSYFLTYKCSNWKCSPLFHYARYCLHCIDDAIILSWTCNFQLYHAHAMPNSFLYTPQEKANTQEDYQISPTEAPFTVINR